MISNPALFDNSLELLENNNKMHFVQSGKTLPLEFIPEEPKMILTKSMIDHPHSEEAFAYWGLKSENEKLTRFTKCQYGLANNNPDIDVNGKLSAPEYKYCEDRVRCLMNGKFCVGIDLKHGRLTNREVEVTTLIGMGLSDKVICSQLCISQDTLRNHKNHIEAKADINGKVQIAWIAFEFQLVQKRETNF